MKLANRFGIVFCLLLFIALAGFFLARRPHAPPITALPLSPVQPAAAQDPAPPSAPEPVAAAAPQKITTPDMRTFKSFDAWVHQYTKAAPPRQTFLEAQGVALAKERRANMLRLIELDPEKALAMAIPRPVRKELPPAVVQLLEEPISTRATYDVMIVEVDDGISSDVRRQVTIDDRTYRAFVYGRREHVTSKNNMPLHGIVLDDEAAIHESPVRELEQGEDTAPENGIGVDVGGEVVHVDSPEKLKSLEDELIQREEKLDPDSTKGEVAPLVAALGDSDHPVAADGGGGGGGGGSVTNAWTMGPKNILVIRVDFSDFQGEPVSPSAASNLVMGQVNPFYCVSSYGKTWITNVTVTPLYRMPRTAAAYSAGSHPTDDPNNLYNEYSLRADALAIALSNGLNYLNFDRDLLGFAGPSGYGFSGLAYVGTHGAWINGVGSWNLHTVAHELGHNWGVWHANRWYPTNFEARTTMGPGLHTEYGNLFDIMGVGGPTTNNHFNAWFKNRLDWLVIADGDATTIATSGTYRIYANDVIQSTGQVRALVIPRPNSTALGHNFWVSYRATLTTFPWLLNGAEVNGGFTYNTGSYLFDMTPETTDIKDTPLIIGRSFSDPSNDIHITATALGGTSPESLDVVVSIGTKAGDTAPTASLAGSTNAASINQAVTFTATASDDDDDPLAYWWNFDESDGSLAPPFFSSNAPTASYKWTNEGFYVVECHVSDMKGKEAVAPYGVLVGTNALQNADGETNLANGIEYAYYESAFASIDDLNTLTPVEYGTVTNFNLDARNRDVNFGFRFTGWVDIPQEGVWTFYTSSDDASRLYIGTNLVVNNDGFHTDQERVGFAALKAGKHRIRVDYLQATGAFNLVVSYASDGTAKQEIPAGAAYRFAGPTVDVPTISPNGGTYTSSVEVTISTTTSATTIYYTMNSGNPATNSNLYSGPFTLLHTGALIKAYAVKSGYRDSYISQAVFVFPGVSNGAPTLDAGPDMEITLPQTAHLAGSGSDDGIPMPPGAISYKWSWPYNEGVLFSDSNSPITVATFTNAGTYTLRLTGTDSVLTNYDQVTLIVNPTGAVNHAPTVYAGADQTVVLPDGLTVTATAEDDGLPVTPGYLTYLWWTDEGPDAAQFDDDVSLTSGVTFPTEGVYTLGFEAYDGQFSSADYMYVTVLLQNAVSTPNINPDGGVFTNSVNVSLSCETDDSSIYYTTYGTPTTGSRQYIEPWDLQYSTTIRAIGTADGLNDSEVAAAQFTLLGDGGEKIYLHETFYGGGDDVWDHDTYSGNGDVYFEDDLLVLDCSQNLSTLGDNFERERYFSRPFAPMGTNGLVFRALLNRFSSGGSSTTLYFTAALKLGDGANGPTPFDIEVTAQPPFTQASVYVESGDYIDGTVISNLQDYLDGSATNGLWLSIFGDDTNAQFKVTTRDGAVLASLAGLHNMDLTSIIPTGVVAIAEASVYNGDENSGGGAIYIDELDLRSESTASLNGIPVVNAGPDQQVSLSTNAVQLDGSATDDGIPEPPGALTYLWTQQSGPASAQFADDTQPDTTVVFPTNGTYTLRLTANDGESSGIDNVVITVNPPPPATTPVVIPNGGRYETPVSVTITSISASASIYYTTNGSNPSLASPVYTGPFTLYDTAIIKAFASGGGYSPSIVRNATFYFMPATPTITPNGGTFSSPVTVTMSNATVGASIYYTTDGTTPTTNSTLYTAPFSHDGTATIKAVGVKAGLNNSFIATANFVFAPVTPTLIPAGASANNDLTVTISTPTTNASIYFTVNGATPTTNSTLYTGPLVLTSNTTVRAIAAKSGYSNSAVAVGSYGFFVSTPTVLPAAGTKNNPTTVSLSSLTTNASLYYTLDGSSPYSNGTLYAGTFVVDSNLTVRASGTKPGYGLSSIANVAYTFAAAAPTFSPNGGGFSNAVNVSLATITTNGTIYFTTNGVTPTTNSILYAGPITLDGMATVKALAARSGYSNSSVAQSALYNFTVAPPTITPSNGTFGNAATITFASITTNATFYYTINGAAPTTNSSFYSGPFELDYAATVRVIGAKERYNQSVVRTAAFSFAASAPSAIPNGGSFSNPASVTLVSATTNASIYYTLDGSSPTTNSSLFVVSFALDSSTSIRSFAAKAGYASSAISTSAPFAFTVAVPTLSPSGGSFTDPVTVSLSTTTTNAALYYTTDGSTPTTNSTLYTSPFSQDVSATVKVVGVKAGYSVSGVGSAAFTLVAQSPQFNPNGGSFGNSVAVTLTSGTSNSAIRYTSNGTEPTTNSTLYTAPFDQDSNATLRAIATKAGYAVSATSTSAPFAYMVNTPTILPDGGSFTGTVNITLESATTNASMYYTTDGSAPTTSSTPYTGPIALGISATLKAIGAKAGYDQSSVASASFSVTPTGYSIAGAGNYYFEAEWYTRIAGSAVVVIDTNASATNAVLAPDLMGTAAWTEHDFQLNVATTFYVWVRAGGPAASADTMMFSMDGGAEVQRSTTQNGTYRWDKAMTNVLSAGLHTLKIRANEDGVFWDKILLTTTSSLTPTGLGSAALSPPNGVPTCIKDAMSVYTFAGVAPSDSMLNAFECDVDVFPFAGDTNNLNSKTEATSNQYASLSADDTNKWVTADPGSQDEIFMWFDMVVDEPVTNITFVELVWSGNTSANTAHGIYVKKVGAAYEQNASWVQMGGNTTINNGADRTIAEYITSDFTNYVNVANGTITWGVAESASAQPMSANHARLIVHHRGASSVRLCPTADTYIDQASSASNFGGAQNLVALRYSTNSAKKAYLKFNVAALSNTVTGARLRLYSEATAASNVLLAAVYSLTNDTWTESTITWNNAPAPSVAALDTRSAPTPRSYIDFDVTTFVQAEAAGDGTASFVLYEAAALGNQSTMQAKSKEAFASDRNAPPADLIITTSGSPP